MTREEALGLALEWAEGRRSHLNEFMSAEPAHELGGPLNRPQTLALVAQADAAEAMKWAAVAQAIPPDDPPPPPAGPGSPVSPFEGVDSAAAKGIAGARAIRCGWATLQFAGLAMYDYDDLAKMVGMPFTWFRWPNVGAIVAVEDVGEGRVRVEVWAVP